MACSGKYYFFSKIIRLPRKLLTLYYKFCNKVKFKLSGVTYGSGMHVVNKMYLQLSKDSTLIIGDDFEFTSGDGFNPLCRSQRGMIFLDEHATVLIGNNVGMSSPCLWAKNFIKIGDNVRIGGDCIILDNDCHSLDWAKRKETKLDTQDVNSKPIIIENDVMIGTRCIILKGVSIGARTIIAAGSVVTKNIPSDCIAGGNPCKVIKVKRK